MSTHSSGVWVVLDWPGPMIMIGRSPEAKCLALVLAQSNGRAISPVDPGAPNMRMTG